MGDLEISSLTWELEDSETEITRKRKGEFPTSTRGKRKKEDLTKIQERIREVLADSERLEKERRERENELEVVPVGNHSNQEAGLHGDDSQVVAMDGEDGFTRFDSDAESDGGDNEGHMNQGKSALLAFNGASLIKPNVTRGSKTTPAKKTMEEKSSIDGASVLGKVHNGVKLVDGKKSLKAFGGMKAFADVKSNTEIQNDILKAIREENVISFDEEETKTPKNKKVSNNKTDKGKPNKKKTNKSVENETKTSLNSQVENPPADTQSDNESVSSADTETFLANKKTSQGVAVQPVSKTSKVKSWVEDTTNEFSSGVKFTPGNVLFDTGFGRKAWAVNFDSDDELDDFEMFAKRELRKLETQKKNQTAINDPVNSEKHIHTDERRKNEAYLQNRTNENTHKHFANLHLETKVNNKSDSSTTNISNLNKPVSTTSENINKYDSDSIGNQSDTSSRSEENDDKESLSSVEEINNATSKDTAELEDSENSGAISNESDTSSSEAQDDSGGGGGSGDDDDDDEEEEE